MPQLEAANCGLPVISVDYSAMQSVIKNIGGFGVIPSSYYVECETGCKRAIPNNEAFINLLKQLHEKRDLLPEIGANIRANALENYSWSR